MGYYNIHYELGAAGFDLLLIMLTHLKKTLPTKENKNYRYTMYAVLISSCLSAIYGMINVGDSIRQWTGKPYASKQVEIGRLTKEDGIGIQMLTFYNNDIEQFNLPEINDDHTWHLEDIAENDGLDIFSWLDWFKDYDLSQPMAIIHFTKFRYR